MARDFLAQFLGSPNRARILRVFLLNEGEVLGAREVAKRAGISLQAAVRELEALTALGICAKAKGARPVQGRAKSGALPVWTVDRTFRHLQALSAFVRDTSPVQNTNVLSALKGSGRLSLVIASGFFTGDPSRPADLIIAGEALDVRRIERAMKALEPEIGRELRYAAFSTPEFRYRLTVQDRLVRDTLDYPHRVLLNRVGLV